MATITEPKHVKVPTTPEARSDGFRVVGSDRSLGYNLPQRMGRVLQTPMFLMALMAFAVAFVIAIVRADTIATGGGADTAARLQHVGAGSMFIGFTAVLSAVTFAIARILGRFRDGGGRVQEAVSGHVQTLRMPATARAMVLLMMMGMMLVLVPVVLHFVAAASVVGPTEAELRSAERWFAVLEGIRRFGIANHLLAIALGLATIVHVLRFQAIRVRELPDESRGLGRGRVTELD